MMHLINSFLTPSKNNTDNVDVEEEKKENSSANSSFENKTRSTSSLELSPIKNSDQYGQSISQLQSSSSFSSSSLETNLNAPDSQKSLFLYIIERLNKTEKRLEESIMENVDLRSSNAIMEQNISSIMKNQELLMGKVDSLSKENTSLNQKIDNIGDRYEATDTKQGELEHSISIKMDDLSEVNEILDEKVDNLHEENKFLDSKFDDLMKLVKTLGEDIVKINIEKVDSDVEDSDDELENQDNVAINSCMENINTLSKGIETVLDKISKTQVKLEIEKERNNNFENHLDEIFDELYRIDSEVIKTNQYNRRQNLIIEGIPDKVPQHALQDICIDVVTKLGFFITRYEVVGCHRLRKSSAAAPGSPAPTIIRFNNRKIAEFCMRNRYHLPQIQAPWKLTFREDLCTSNEKVLQECIKLKENGVISHFITSNGFVKIFEKKGAKPSKISHPADLETLFPDFYEVF